MSREDIPDDVLDSLVLEAFAGAPKEKRSDVDHSDVAAYVAGDLDGSRTAEIRLALLKSPHLRRAVADAARAAAGVEQPETISRFDTASSQAAPAYRDFLSGKHRAARVRPTPDQGRSRRSGKPRGAAPSAAATTGRRRWVVSLLLAFLVPVALLGYPAARYLSSGPRPVEPAGVLLRTTSLQLEPQAETESVDPSGAMPVARVDENVDLLRLQLALPTGVSGPHMVEVFGPRSREGGREVVRLDPGAGRTLDVTLDARVLTPGVWTARATAATAGPERIGRLTYRWAVLP